MKKIILLISLISLMAIGLFANTTYPFVDKPHEQFRSNTDATLQASVTVYVYQWIRASIDPVSELRFQYYAEQWQGADGKGELLGTFNVHSNNTLRINLEIKSSGSSDSDRIVNSITKVDIIPKESIESKYFDPVPGKTSALATLDRVEAVKSHSFDIKAIFNIDKNFTPTDRNGAVINYTITFEPDYYF
ncbi:MAG TPA: hypothetical protein PKI73_06680 [Petrotogaceae bacterium]|mgnify:FL=1|nr:hypothetical protein [Petrotogaceae bacterium]